MRLSSIQTPSKMRCIHPDVAPALTRNLPPLRVRELWRGAGLKRREARRLRWDQELVTDHAGVERAFFFAQTFDVELQGLLGVGGRLVERVALSVEIGEVGGVDVVAALLLGAKTSSISRGWSIPFGIGRRSYHGKCRRRVRIGGQWGR